MVPEVASNDEYLCLLTIELPFMLTPPKSNIYDYMYI